MVMTLHFACLFVYAWCGFASWELEQVSETCVFDGVSAAAMSLLQKSAKLVGLSDDTYDVGANMPATPLLKSIVVPLRKVGVRQIDGFMSPRTYRLRSTKFHVGEITVGNPGQSFQVLFDTSADYSWLPLDACRSRACRARSRYSPSKSSTAVNTAPRHEKSAVRKTQTTYAHTDIGQGNMSLNDAHDMVCLGHSSSGEACLDMVFGAAEQLDDVPFRHMPNDGIIGLGLGLRHQKSYPMFSFLARLFESSGSVLPHFGIWLGKDGGEIHLGGHELADLATPLRWLPVFRPEDGYWQAEIRAIRVGNITIKACSSGCHAIVDTGVTHVGAHVAMLPELRESLVTKFSANGSCTGPDMTFDLGNVELTLRAQDYASDECVPQLGSFDWQEAEYQKAFTFGETMLQRYYVAFDWEKQKLGFAMLSNSPIPAGKHAPRSMNGAIIV